MDGVLHKNFTRIQCMRVVQARVWTKWKSSTRTGPEGWGPRGEISRFFPSPATKIRSFFLSLGFSRGIVAAVQGHGPPMVPVCAPREAQFWVVRGEGGWSGNQDPNRTQKRSPKVVSFWTFFLLWKFNYVSPQRGTPTRARNTTRKKGNINKQPAHPPQNTHSKTQQDTAKTLQTRHNTAQHGTTRHKHGHNTATTTHGTHTTHRHHRKPQQHTKHTQQQQHHTNTMNTTPSKQPHRAPSTDHRPPQPPTNINTTRKSGSHPRKSMKIWITPTMKIWITPTKIWNTPTQTHRHTHTHTRNTHHNNTQTHTHTQHNTQHTHTTHHTTHHTHHTHIRPICFFLSSANFFEFGQSDFGQFRVRPIRVPSMTFDEYHINRKHDFQFIFISLHYF